MLSSMVCLQHRPAVALRHVVSINSKEATALLTFAHAHALPKLDLGVELNGGADDRGNGQDDALGNQQHALGNRHADRYRDQGSGRVQVMDEARCTLNMTVPWGSCVVFKTSDEVGGQMLQNAWLEHLATQYDTTDIASASLDSATGRRCRPWIKVGSWTGQTR